MHVAGGDPRRSGLVGTVRDRLTARDRRTASPTRFRRQRQAVAAQGGPATRPRHPAQAETVWPVKAARRAPARSCLAKRIVAYYGNPLSKRMGILGEFPPDEMLASSIAKSGPGSSADSTTPVPALHLIAVVAQGTPAGTASTAPQDVGLAHRARLRLGAAAQGDHVPRRPGGQEHAAAGTAAPRRSCRAPTCTSASTRSSP